MEKKKKWFAAGGFLFTAAAGTCLHFVYEWSGRQAWVGLFAPVSESVWEHLKLLFFPALFWAAAWWFWGGKKEPGFFLTALEGIWAGLGAIIVPFYTYTGILGFSWAPLDIALFYFAAGCCYAYSLRKGRKAGAASRRGAFILAATLLLLLGFWFFTYAPPQLGIFANPK